MATIRVAYEEMPRLDYKRCRGCGRPTTETGPLSHVRLCERCGAERMVANNLQIHAKAGPFYEKRRLGYAMREFGPRVVQAMIQTGIIDGDLVDATRPGT